MQIGTIIGQLIAGSQKTEKPKETTARTSAGYELLKNLVPGSVFEGTILEVKNGQAMIGLANGEVIQARLDLVLDLMQGSSMFFQVKSKDDLQIAIKPYTQEPMHNPTLLNALQSAGVEITDKNLSMVSAMMEEQMPIDKQSVLAMVRNRMDYPQAEIKTVVQMAKYQLPLSEANLIQFEHYKNDQAQVMKQLNVVIDDILKTVNQSQQGNSEVIKLNLELAKIFNIGQEGKANIDVSQKDLLLLAKEEIAENLENNVGKNQSIIQDKSVDVQKMVDNPTRTDKSLETAKTVETVLGTNEKIESEIKFLEQAKAMLESWSKGGGELQQKPETVYREIIKLVLQAQEKAQEQTQVQASSQGNELSQELSELFQKKEFRTLFQQVMERNWTLEPENLRDENAVAKLYEKLVKQLSQLDQLFSSQGKEVENLGKSMTEVRNQVQFMNDLNQMYHYIQIPLKLFKQNTTGDLYVFTHKKTNFEPGEEITAHLHLQMEHLGTTDVYVRLNQKKISTHFYMEKEDSFDLIMDNIDLLTQKLQDRGYEVTIQSENATKKIDFVEDFLSINKPVGRVQRYTFDVRA